MVVFIKLSDCDAFPGGIDTAVLNRHLLGHAVVGLGVVRLENMVGVPSVAVVAHTVEDTVRYKVGYNEAYEDCVGDLWVVGQELSGLIWVGKCECLQCRFDRTGTGLNGAVPSSLTVSRLHAMNVCGAPAAPGHLLLAVHPLWPRSGTYSKVDKDVRKMTAGGPTLNSRDLKEKGLKSLGLRRLPCKPGIQALPVRAITLE
ncbi:hypothetical protein B0H17DRAFT_1129193 [Mycena rosella]|uniref:Uncharacterized protein n=1 Tax=Mycena rosella TaxID=1033263 RepID=A0AAD7GKY5_MYCRO|nr:hypothetical protein B0H17DRAFT_1129193 [Mycena rosella]